MERLALLIDETEKALRDCSLGARGLYLTLHILAHRKGGDDINNGRPLLGGKEVTPRLLSAIYEGKPNIAELTEYFGELEKAGLWNDGRLTTFSLDNKPILIIRKANRKRRGTKYRSSSGQTEMELSGNSGKDSIGKDSKGLDKTGLPPGDVKDPLGVWFFNHYRYCTKGKRPALQERDVPRLEKLYGRKKIHDAMIDVLGSGYGWGVGGASIERYIKGEWDKPSGGSPSGKGGRREQVYKGKGAKK